ncbi:MAG: folylpolyglutamate synthase/dihydrofolate synthase family protein [Candidatus Micrarchaeota archaeon]
MGCTYEEALDGLYSLARALPPRQYLLGMRKLLARLGNPQDDFESIIVTGTNGKGSVTAMAASALKRSGMRTGRYLSPSVDDFRERICINDRMIQKKRFAELYELVLRKAKLNEPVTFFEFLTSMMFEYFSEEEVDCAVLEVGLGGRLDATNLAYSKLGAITEIGLEHTEFLGKTLTSIAREKAGIVRENGALLSAEWKREPLSTIETVCKGKNAKLIRVGEDITFKTVACTSERNEYEIFGLNGIYSLSLSMLGSHQGRNAAIAVGLSELAGADESAIERGVGEAKLPGRLEVVSKKPYVVMDCAHNPHAAKELAKSLELFDYEKLVLVVGMMKDKNHVDFLGELAPKADYLVLNEPGYGRAEKLEGIFGVGMRFCDRTIGIKDAQTSLKIAKSLAGPKDLICIAGSIYMLSEMRGHKAGVTQ